MHAALILALLLPSAVAARCPVSDDISRGIVYASTLGESESIHVAMGTSSFLASYYELGDYGLTKQFLLLKGAYPLSLTTIVTDEALTISYHYPIPQAGFPEPAPGVNWQVEAVVAQGEVSLTELHSYTFGGEVERQIGNCSYLVVPYDIETSSDVYGAQVLPMFYIPVLGVSFPDSSREAGVGEGVEFSERMTTYPDLLTEWGN
ncbi:hypothetical protein [Oceanicola sp. S124]|uniref:hypothetical protein n=1 Tax=Oceanicola sp. S124 TaxID=1042378 RepID=UPI00025589FE|nr:hypothetical protein [Oceanicola sp. S124]